MEDSRSPYPRRPLRNHGRNTIYNENKIDEILDGQLGVEFILRRKRKGFDIDKEMETEKLIASSVGFPLEGLTDEEIAYGLSENEVGTYVVVRNHIIARWRENVHGWLSRKDVMESIMKEHRPIVDSAYDFLVKYGYINFGVAPAVRAAIPVVATKGSVVIIGAGLAGLSAALQLRGFGFKVAIVEGRNRPGGRVYTEKMEGPQQVAAVELGGSIISGTHGNPLAVLARQLGIPLHKVREQCPMYKTDGSSVDGKLDKKMFNEFNKLLGKTSEWRDLIGKNSTNDTSLGAALEAFRLVFGVGGSKEELQLLNWHFANLEFANATLLSNLSVAYWDQDDPYEFGGDHCWLPGGNCRLIHAMAENVPIFCNNVVNEIIYNDSGVKVISGSQVFQADMALCTVPLGVLKKGSIKFVPDLPERKVRAIERLGYGILNKLVMLFPYVFWEGDTDYFGCLNSESSERGEFFLFLNYVSVAGSPVLIALLAGEAAIKFETMVPEDSAHCALGILRGIYKRKGISVPDPLQVLCTKWGADPLSYGSYSHVAIGSSGSDYDILAETLGEGRLFFAGEATTSQYPATMHGAFFSGLREAAKISQAAESRMLDIDNVIRKDNASLLDNLFKEPNLKFGVFSVLLDPYSFHPKSNALIRVLFEWRKTANNSRVTPECQLSNKHNCKYQPELQDQLKLYAVVERQQAFQLSEIKEGDETRLLYLCQQINAKLVGRRKLGRLGDSLVSSVKRARTVHKMT